MNKAQQVIDKVREANTIPTRGQIVELRKPLHPVIGVTTKPGTTGQVARVQENLGRVLIWVHWNTEKPAVYPCVPGDLKSQTEGGKPIEQVTS